MTWNHRIVKEKAGDDCWYYSVREVYYEDNGEIWGFSQEPRAAFGESKEELRETLQRMLNAVDRPILIVEDGKVTGESDE